jgi:hypothetical protein
VEVAALEAPAAEVGEVALVAGQGERAERGGGDGGC